MAQFNFDYGFYSDCLKECYTKFGDVLQFSVISDPYSRIRDYYAGGNILDFGAGKETILRSILNDRIDQGCYYSLDNDPLGNFSFQKFEDIPENLKFSLIVANQVFEHLDINDSLMIIKKMQSILNDKGLIISTVPNISHPNRQISNITHLTAWGFNGLYFLYKYAGVEVTAIHRYSKRHPRGMIELFLAKYISRIYRMDWCDSVMVVGENTRSGHPM